RTPHVVVIPARRADSLPLIGSACIHISLSTRRIWIHDCLGISAMSKYESHYHQYTKRHPLIHRYSSNNVVINLFTNCQKYYTCLIRRLVFEGNCELQDKEYELLELTGRTSHRRGRDG